MAHVNEFSYRPDNHESEKASNSYLMSLVAVIAGAPLPIINLLATLFFYFGNRRSTFFVRWHCTQALLSQLMVLSMNSAGFYWTASIIWGSDTITNAYIAYMLTVVVFNFGELIATIYAAILTRKGEHVSFWFFGPLTTILCKP